MSNDSFQQNKPVGEKSLTIDEKITYNHQRIERKWQRIWEKIGIFWAKDFSKKKKFYCLDMFPYPSGEGLHVGHPRGYTATDVFSRFMRRKGYNVLHPMGWDAFGLPAENYAIKTGIHPEISTRRNIKNFKRQIKSLGLGYDWRREVSTSDADYYRLTQWIFLLLFKKGLAYEAVLPINWCPSCKTGLANEEVVDGKCDRCHSKVGKKDLRQWVLKITAYADRLLDDLKELDWPEKIKEMQRNWIGRSEGWEIRFALQSRLANLQSSIEVFTTRADTLFGATYLVLAPEHPIIENLKDQIRNYSTVKSYIEEAKNKTERERISEVKEKSGIEVNGIFAINPVNSREIPIWVADYVLMHYGTGAIMAVPAHDKRDFSFAKSHNLSIIEVIKLPEEKKRLPKEAPLVISDRGMETAYEDEGILINSLRFDGMRSSIAAERIGEWLAKKGLAKKAVHYKLRDWIFSRQRYWGEPIPIIRCQKCGLVPLSERDLPLRLPRVNKYQPTGTGESPLAAIERWVKVICPKCKGPAERETNTMPQWAGSCWYYLAYLLGDWSKITRKRIAWNKKRIRYWLPVDLYVGGAEHAVLHLLYARFWHKFLYDMKLVSTKEPFLKLKNQGLILAPDGQKMSKSRGNVISPDEIVEKYGADTLRLYEMFMGPFDQEIAWSVQGIKGCRRFLDRVWRLRLKVSKNRKDSRLSNSQLEDLLNNIIKKVSGDIENFHFNTAVSSLMVASNEMEKQEKIELKDYETFLMLLAPFAPHLAEELWQKVHPKPKKSFQTRDSLHSRPWPKYDEKLVKERRITLIVQINGKVRDKVETEADISKEQATEIVLSREKVQKWIGEKKVQKVIFVSGKIINLVVL